MMSIEESYLSVNFGTQSQTFLFLSNRRQTWLNPANKMEHQEEQALTQARFLFKKNFNLKLKRHFLLGSRQRFPGKCKCFTWWFHWCFIKRWTWWARWRHFSRTKWTSNNSCFFKTLKNSFSIFFSRQRIPEMLVWKRMVMIRKMSSQMRVSNMFLIHKISKM